MSRVTNITVLMAQKVRKGYSDIVLRGEALVQINRVILNPNTLITSFG